MENASKRAVTPASVLSEAQAALKGLPLENIQAAFETGGLKGLVLLFTEDLQ